MTMRFPRRSVSIAALIALLLPASGSHAFGLLDAYAAALENDPVYRAAIHENEAGQEEKAIGLSGLLPNLSFTHAQSKNTGRQKFGGQAETSLDFDSQVSTLSLRQPILDLEAVAGYRQGAAQANWA